MFRHWSPPIALLFVLSGCNSQQLALQKAAEENPEIFFSILEKNPVRFVEVLEKARLQAAQIQREKSEIAAKAQMQKEFKEPVEISSSAKRASRGPEDAPIEIVEFSDFQCPFCKTSYETLEQIRVKYGDKVRITFRHFPLTFHAMAAPAAKRYEAIVLENKEMANRFHDAVFKNQDRLREGGEALLDKLAKQAGANVALMKQRMKSPEVRTTITEDIVEARKLGITGTPGYVIAGVTVRGARSRALLESIIDQRLQGATTLVLEEK